MLVERQDGAPNFGTQSLVIMLLKQGRDTCVIRYVGSGCSRHCTWGYSRCQPNLRSDESTRQLRRA